MLILKYVYILLQDGEKARTLQSCACKGPDPLPTRRREEKSQTRNAQEPAKAIVRFLMRYGGGGRGRGKSRIMQKHPNLVIDDDHEFSEMLTSVLRWAITAQGAAIWQAPQPTDEGKTPHGIRLLRLTEHAGLVQYRRFLNRIAGGPSAGTRRREAKAL
jgi:hypothetical protein